MVYMLKYACHDIRSIPYWVSLPLHTLSENRNVRRRGPFANGPLRLTFLFSDSKPHSCLLIGFLISAEAISIGATSCREKIGQEL